MTVRKCTLLRHAIEVPYTSLDDHELASQIRVIKMGLPKDTRIFLPCVLVGAGSLPMSCLSSDRKASRPLPSA